MQLNWYSFSSWPHSDVTSLSRSVTCTFLTLPFLNRISILFKSIHVAFPATQNMCDRYNNFAIVDHLKIILCKIGNL